MASNGTGGALRACSKADYGLRIGSQGATGGLVAMINLLARSSTPCRLHAHLMFTVQRVKHANWKTAGGISGNPARTIVAGALRRGVPAWHDWPWWNYCGNRGRFRFLAESGGHRATTPVTPPACDSEGTGPGGIEPFPPRH